MSSVYQNIVGSLAWIASRDREASDDLNELRESAGDTVSQVVAAIYLADLAGGSGLDEAKAELIRACRDEKLRSNGHTSSNEENRSIPSTSWIGASIDEVEGTIGKTRPTWLGVSFKTADLRELWKAPPALSTLPPKKRTGPRPKWRKVIQGIMDQHCQQVKNALDKGEEPPPPPTSRQIADALSSPHGRVSERTVRDNLLKIRGKDGSWQEPEG